MMILLYGFYITATENASGYKNFFEKNPNDFCRRDIGLKIVMAKFLPSKDHASYNIRKRQSVRHHLRR